MTLKSVAYCNRNCL